MFSTPGKVSEFFSFFSSGIKLPLQNIVNSCEEANIAQGLWASHACTGTQINLWNISHINYKLNLLLKPVHNVRYHHLFDLNKSLNYYKCLQYGSDL